MSVHPEERRIAGLLRELIVQSGTTLEMVEKYRGWKSGRLADRLDGKVRLSFEDVLEILPVLNATPADFFAWLYGFDPKEAGTAVVPEAGLAGALASQGTDRRFDSSLRAVKDAVSRRETWKQERSQDKKAD